MVVLVGDSDGFSKSIVISVDVDSAMLLKVVLESVGDSMASLDMEDGLE